MMKRLSTYLFPLLLLFSLQGCSGRETGIEGEVSFHGTPLGLARVEFYLKNGGERSSAPFSVATTDAQGHFKALLPPGNYYLVGKKKEQGAGLNRMLMAEYSRNPVVVASGLNGIESLVLSEVGFEGSIRADGITRINGLLEANGQPLDQAFVYVYTRGDSLTGPAYGQVVQSDDKGRFQLDLAAGRYWLAARKRQDGSRVGDPVAGDFSGVYAENPVTLRAGQQLQLNPWALKPLTRAAKERRLADGKFAATPTRLSGRVVDQDQAPIAGIYLFAYRDSRMIGKPNFISMPSAADGHFLIYLDQGGEYFVGARSTFGGPLEPGEWVGTYDARADHGVKIAANQVLDLGDIVVREVW